MIAVSDAGSSENRLRMLKTLAIMLSSIYVQLNESKSTDRPSTATSLWQIRGGRASAACAGTSCGSCERRFGCLTEAWGRCCVQFFQLNGKRSAPTEHYYYDDDDDVMDRRRSALDDDVLMRPLVTPERLMRDLPRK